MPEPPKKPNYSNPHNLLTRQDKQQLHTSTDKTVMSNELPLEITKRIVNTITGLKSLAAYPIRDLVKHAEEFGPYLKHQRLETNQIRKFLDAVNQLKAKLAQGQEEQIDALDKFKAKLEQEYAEIKQKLVKEENEGIEDFTQRRTKIEQEQEKTKHELIKSEREKLNFKRIETDVVLLKPKLAYAAARQKAAKPMSDVMSPAIDKVHSTEDFERLVQLIESIIAYHKAEGGK
jgi:CRISPR-associated protein Csm2